MIGDSPGADISPAGSGSFALPAALTAEEHVALAEQGSVALALATLDVEIATADLRDARAERAPSLDLSGQLARSSLEQDGLDAIAALGDDRGFTTYGASLDLTVSLGGRAAASSRQQAEAALSAARIQQENTRRELSSAVMLAVMEIQLAEQDISLAVSRLDAALLAEDGQASRLAVGSSRLDELIAARDTRFEAAVSVEQARQSLALAHLELARLEGRLDRVLQQ